MLPVAIAVDDSVNTVDTATRAREKPFVPSPGSSPITFNSRRQTVATEIGCTVIGIFRRSILMVADVC